MLDIEGAIKELKTKSMNDIERETALKWGGRAAASYDLSMKERRPEARFRRFYEGENFRQEALEHASMAEDGGELMREVHDEVAGHRETALKALQSVETSAPA